MRYSLCIIFLIIMSSLLVPQEAPRFGGSLNIGLQADIGSLYPWQIKGRGMESLLVLQNVYEPLVRFKKDSADIEPCLATKWMPSKDYKTWTFNLRRDVKFHDGTAFNADSVVNTFALIPQFTATVKKIDDYTVLFTLEKPNAAFVISLSIEYYSVAAAASIACSKEKCNKQVAIGTGPFIFEQWTPGKDITLRANLNYWNKRPYLDKVSFIIIKNNADLINQLKAQKIQLTLGILPNNIAEIKNIPHLNFQSLPALSIGYLAMNNEKPPFNNKKVRMAISHAINKKELVNKYFFNGQAGIVAKGCLPAAMFGYDKEQPDREYNPQKAKALLKEAGFPDGFETTLTPTAAIRSYSPDPEGIAVDIQKYLGTVGIKAQIVPEKSWKDYLDKTHVGTFELALTGWMADTVDPNDFLTFLLTTPAINSTNTARWSNSIFDNLIEQARMQSISERIKSYQEAQKIFYEEMPFVPIANSMQLAAWNAKVKGFKLHPASRLSTQYIWLSKGSNL